MSSFTVFSNLYPAPYTRGMIRIAPTITLITNPVIRPKRKVSFGDAPVNMLDCCSIPGEKMRHAKESLTHDHGRERKKLDGVRLWLNNNRNVLTQRRKLPVECIKKYMLKHSPAGTNWRTDCHCVL